MTETKKAAYLLKNFLEGNPMGILLVDASCQDVEQKLYSWQEEYLQSLPEKKPVDLAWDYKPWEEPEPFFEEQALVEFILQRFADAGVECEFYSSHDIQEVKLVC